ncbi:MAG: hypothetical protein AAF493_24855, partial [Pseudomonadota bacterium]
LVPSVGLCLVPSPGLAHGFGQRFDLPLPLWLWLTGAGLTVVLSFVIAAWHIRESSTGHQGSHSFSSSVLVLLLSIARWACAGLFLLVIATGWFGIDDPYKNFAPTAFWILWWVGVVYASALIGNVWAWINPIATLAGVAQWLSARAGIASTGFTFRYRFGYWPAVVVFVLFASAEFIWEGGEEPRNVALMAGGYAVYCWVGMVLFGRDEWLSKADPFTVLFAALARFAPFHYSLDETGRAHFDLRWPGYGLTRDYPIAFSHAVLIFVLLTSVTFDGFLETPLWLDLSDRIMAIPQLETLWDSIEAHTDSLGVLSLMLLVASVIGFVLLMWITCWAVARSGNFPVTGVSHTTAVFCSFTLSLIPIAIAYHLAHYVSLLVISSQYLIPLASDPFGFGWDLFGSTDYEVNIGILSVTVVWYAAAAAIVIGHVVAVYVAHVIAMRLTTNRRDAVVSQVPMMVLMVAYTMVSLWILAQPIVG